MYSVLLMAVLAGAEQQPSSLFARGGGCAGATAEATSCGGQQAGLFQRREGRRHIFPLFHRRGAGGCSGNAQASYGCSGASMYVAPAGYSQMPVGPTAVNSSTLARFAAFDVGAHVKHPAGQGFPAGTGVITLGAVRADGPGFVYKVHCDQTGKVLPVNFKESELSAIP